MIERICDLDVTLADLLAGITDENRRGSVDAGSPVGDEALRALAYVPEAGDVVWLSFDKQSGHEPAGHRPTLVLSPANYSRIGLMLCCPMTSEVKGYPFEVPIARMNANDRPSVVLSNQVKNLGWRARRARREGQVGETELATVRARAMALLRGS